MSCLILGATAGVGRALAEEAAQRGHDLLLVGGDLLDLRAMASDLQLFHGVRVELVCCRFVPGADTTASLERVVEAFGEIENILLPIGASRDDDRGMLNVALCREIVESNLLSVVALVSALWPRLATQRYANITGFGSVASVRGRSTNVVYAAAKRALTSYFESLRHKASDTGICVQYYQLGYVETQQTFGRSLRLPTIRPEDVAKRVFDNLGRDLGVVFLPKWWWMITTLVRALPWIIFKRLNF